MKNNFLSNILHFFEETDILMIFSFVLFTTDIVFANGSKVRTISINERRQMCIIAHMTDRYKVI